jgi:hypothetical protein
MTSIDFSKIINLLQTVDMGYSQYEFDNFLIDTCPTPARQLIMVMEKILDLQNPLNRSDSLGVDMGSHDRDKVQLKKLVEWFNKIPNPQAILEKFEQEEPTYWTHVLGKTAAVEILSRGKTTIATMEKMGSLPFADYEECVRICNKYAELIQTVTQGVEKENAPSASNVVKT